MTIPMTIVTKQHPPVTVGCITRLYHVSVMLVSIVTQQVKDLGNVLKVQHHNMVQIRLLDCFEFENPSYLPLRVNSFAELSFQINDTNDNKINIKHKLYLATTLS